MQLISLNIILTRDLKFDLFSLISYGKAQEAYNIVTCVTFTKIVMLTCITCLKQQQNIQLCHVHVYISM